MIYDEFKGKERNDTVLLFVHGSGCNKKFMQSLALRFENYTKILVDLPGHGDDPDREDSDYTYENYITKLVDFLASLEDKQVIVIGHSLGGLLAVDVATRNLPNVKAVVSLSGAAKFENLDAGLVEKASKGVVDLEYLMSQLDQNEETVKAIATMENEDIILKDLIIDSQVDIKDKLKDARTPLVMLAGQCDDLVKPGNSYYVHYNVNDCIMMTVPRCRHMAFLIRADITCMMISLMIDNYTK